MKRKNSLLLLFAIFFIYSCSLQHVITPEHYDYIQAKNQLTTDYALVNEIEHVAIKRLNNNQITSSRAESISKTVSEINFKLDLSKKLLEAGNYQGSMKISKKEFKDLQILYKSILEIK